MQSDFMMATSMHWLVVIVLILCNSVHVKSYRGGAVNRAKCNLRPDNNTPHSSVSGTVHMIQGSNENVTCIKIEISGLPPNSVHGFHIHEFGDIVTEGCKSTGGHYNPFNKTHGAPTDSIRHVGDLGNVYADNNGEVKVAKLDSLVSLVGKYNVLGRAFVLHALIDDLGRGGHPDSKTTGHAGARIACGVIIRAPVEKRS